MVRNYKPKRNKGRLTIVGKSKLLLMHKSGAPIEEIAKELDLCTKNVRQHLYVVTSTGSVLSPPRKPIKPRRRFTTVSRSVRGIALSQPTLTARQIKAIAIEKGHNISVQTVRNILREDGGARFLAVDNVSPLTEAHKVQRLNFSIAMQEKDLFRMVWSDEKWFVVDANTKKTWVFPSRERMEVVKHSHPIKVMVWGAFSTFGRCPLYFFVDNVNAKQYIEVLKHFKAWIRTDTACPQLKNVILQQDNAKPHVSKDTHAAAKRLGIKILPNWPPYSPDLNPIEHMWSMMVPIVDSLRPKTIDDLQAAISTAWSTVTQEQVDTLVCTVYKRFKKCEEAEGGVINKK